MAVFVYHIDYHEWHFKMPWILSIIDFNWDFKIGFKLLQDPSALENLYFSHFIIH